MKKINLIITALIFSLLSLQTTTFAQTADASLELSSPVTEAKVGDEFDVVLTLKNPGLQKVVSVRSWLQFNTNLLQAVSIDTENSPFSLSAPGETDIGADEGLVKLGRSNVSGGFSEKEAKVATIHFKVKTPYATSAIIAPYDFQSTELGHTSANIVDLAFPVNILSREPDSLVIHLNPGAAPYGNQEVTQSSVPQQVSVSTQGFANLQRPQNLAVTTGSGYVDLKWDNSTDMNLSGYNIYYGKTSGMYSRRRTVGKVNQYRLDGLNDKEVYYFAVTAYDSQSKESDYSDEVAVIINEPLSSTSPFEAFSASMFDKVPNEPQNGPLVGWLAFSAFGLGGTLAFRKKQKFN